MIKLPSIRFQLLAVIALLLLSAVLVVWLTEMVYLSRKSQKMVSAQLAAIQAHLAAGRLEHQLSQIRNDIAAMQNDIAAVTFRQGGHYDPGRIILGSRDTDDSLDQGSKGSRDTSNKVEVPCRNSDGRNTLVIVTLGQSNAANSGAGQHTASRDVLNFNLYDGRCYLASDPLLGTSGDGGNFATRLGDILIARGIAHRIILAPIAIGGTKVEQWAFEGMFSRRIQVLLRRLHDAALTPDYILWHQGEAIIDASDTTPGQYSKNLREVVQTFRQYGAEAPFFIALTTRCGGDRNSAPTRAGQRGAVNPQIGTFLGPDTDLIGLEHRYDLCHMSENGLKLHAKAWADVIVDHHGVKPRVGARGAGETAVVQ